jgi:hypothetical protein
MKRGRLWFGVAVMAAALVVPGVASASSGTISLSVSPASPTDANQVLVQVSGMTDSGNATVDVHYRLAGTGNCATDPTQDIGTAVSPDGTTVANGQFAPPSTPQQYVPGNYIFCAWLFDNTATESPVLAQQQVSVTVGVADTLGLSLTAPAVEGRPLTVNAFGRAFDPSAVVDATYKPAGSTCGGDPASDTGTVTDSSGSPAGPGAYVGAVMSGDVFDRGALLVCGWLVDQNTNQVLTRAAVTVVVAPVHATLAIGVLPRIDPNQTVTVTLGADLDHDVPVNDIVDVKPERPGVGCAANPVGEPTSATSVIQDQLLDTQQPQGVVSSTGTMTLSTPGAYILCAWLVSGWSQADPAPAVAGPIAIPVTVLKPLTYHGRTAQRRGIAITVAQGENLITALAFTDHLRCSGRPVTFKNGLRWNGDWSDDLVAGQSYTTLRISPTGTFKLRLRGKAGHTLDIQGRRRGKRLVGTFSESGRSSVFTGNTAQNRPCRTGTVHFTATTP